MPCMCWFQSDDQTKKNLKNLCTEIVWEIKRLEKIGDPIDCELKDIHKLLDHLYYDNCDEKQKN